MATNQEQLQADARTKASSSETFNGDVLSYASAAGITDLGSYNGAYLAALDARLSATHNTLDGALAAAAADAGATTVSGLNALPSLS